MGALSRQTKDWIKFTRLWCHLLVSAGLVAVGWQVLKDTSTQSEPFTFLSEEISLKVIIDRLRWIFKFNKNHPPPPPMDNF